MKENNEVFGVYGYFYNVIFCSFKKAKKKEYNKEDYFFGPGRTDFFNGTIRVAQRFSEDHCECYSLFCECYENSLQHDTTHEVVAVRVINDNYVKIIFFDKTDGFLGNIFYYVKKYGFVYDPNRKDMKKENVCSSGAVVLYYAPLDSFFVTDLYDDKEWILNEKLKSFSLKGSNDQERNYERILALPYYTGE